MMNNTIKSWVKTIFLSPPTLQDNTADADRLILKLKKYLNADQIDIDIYLLRQLPDLIRKWNFRINCILFKNHGHWVLAGITDPNDASPITGLAVDLGTSRVVIRLVDLCSGKSLAESSFDNPQISIGPDILSRIHFADNNEGLKTLNHLIIQGLNKATSTLCSACDTKPENIFLMTIAGNTTMTHLFLGINPHYIIREPYIPAINSPDIMEAQKLGMKINPLGKVLTFPNVGSYFGGDLIAGILFSKIYTKEKTSILVDVGTNAEVVIGNSSWLMACAGAAGPALEGGVTKMGMMAEPGVIDKVTIDLSTRKFDIHTIEEGRPIGICGSGLIDLAAQLFLSGMIDIRGKFNIAKTGSLVKKNNSEMIFTLVSSGESGTHADLTISQADLDSLVRSKAAMYTILETITEAVGLGLNELSTFYVAGTFGSFINPTSAISIGMLPDLPLDNYIALGNSSLGGASMVLTTPACIDEIATIRDRITYMELNVNQDFMNRFSAAKFFTHTDPSLFPSVQIPAQ